jgi:YD repeat-containing protein
MLVTIKSTFVAMFNPCSRFLLLLLVINAWHSYAQEIELFTLNDFDLNNNVKTCLVSTSYGKEEYDFDTLGRLTKAITRFNDADYDLVSYTYKDGELTEKRSESYRDNTFDPSTSIAHVYQLDTLEHRKVTEKIVSYENEFLEQYSYEYDANGDLVKMTRINDEGIDETLVEYKKYKGEYTITYLINNVPLKSIRTSTLKKKNGTVQEVVLIKEFLRGEANKAFEEVFDSSGKLIAKQEFEYKEVEKTFAPTTRTTYSYDENDMLVQEVAKGITSSEKKTYIYQYDNKEDGNWVKQIIAPENSYVTRKITYYKVEVKEK